ncbi:hypothetical protein PIB30_003270 [Stylosanthes scabra]|uniref:Uncharacterized protein n=1 Tax=Stylosanthes scabra TaxID=79078 RepID=A0ABU6S318_9FABA|nr:hypothetical protein [Stylosanthes scabra]
MRSKGEQRNNNKFVWIITTPFRVLGKAKDMYVRSITQCGQTVTYSNPGDAVGRFQNLPRSYSSATSMSGAGSEDYSELVRAASARTLGNRIDVDFVLKQQQQARAQAQDNNQPAGLPKSVSVGMGRIDEDKPFDLNEGDEGVVPNSYPRSRSYAVGVGKRSLVL